MAEIPGLLVSPEDEDLPKRFVWCVASKGYAFHNHRRTQENPTHTLMHRVIVSRIVGRPLTRNEKVDHINGNRLDNRRDNLRLVSNSQNLMNQKMRRDNKSNHVGVYRYRDKWEVYITVNRKRLYLGRYVDIEDAIEVRRKAELEMFGEFSSLICRPHDRPEARP